MIRQVASEGHFIGLDIDNHDDFLIVGLPKCLRLSGAKTRRSPRRSEVDFKELDGVNYTINTTYLSETWS